MTLTLPDLRYLLPDEGASPELWQRYGLRYPSVCVLRHVKVRACALPLIVSTLPSLAQTGGLLGQGSGLGVRHADLPTDTAGFFDACLAFEAMSSSSETSMLGIARALICSGEH